MDVKIERGVVLWRWGRAWCSGDKVHLLPSDAARLERDGAVIQVR